MEKNSELEKILEGIRVAFREPGQERVLGGYLNRVAPLYQEAHSQVNRGSERATPKNSQDLVLAYNSRAVFRDRFSINDFIESVGGIRVTIPSRTISASPSYNTGEKPVFTPMGDGMYFIVGDNVFPVPEVRQEQFMGMNHLYINNQSELLGVGKLFVKRIEEPAIVSSDDSGRWAFRKKGKLILSEVKPSSDFPDLSVFKRPGND